MFFKEMKLRKEFEEFLKKYSSKKEKKLAE